MRDSFKHLRAGLSEGNEEAFRSLFLALYPDLCQFSFSLLKSMDIATEIVDDVFVRLWKSKDAISEIENIRVYLYKATKNASLNHLSRIAQRNIYEQYDDLEIVLTDDSNPENLLITNEILFKIREAVESLPPRCKMIFKLVREDGLKYKNVAEILNISVKTVDAQMVIAVSQLRKRLKKEGFIKPARSNKII